MIEWLKIIGQAIYDRPMRQRLLGYRPVVINLIQATNSASFLFICPSAKPTASMPPQEGIEPGESVEVAAIRCLEAELGVHENQVHFRRSQWLGSKRIPEQIGERDIPYSIRKMQGKAYYGALIKMASDTPININPAEVASFEWLSVDQIKDRLAANSDRKQSLIRKLLGQLLGIEL